ncbi:MAG: phosphate-starvation-inducible PsiE family protein [Proteobacteria bacterium]|nr:phosphate-starvation-inducible PsiE family protein [Pseudomonadota bacterium]
MESFFDNVGKYIAVTLLGLMAIIVVSATAEVAYVVATNILEPPGFFIGVEDLFQIFGLFLMVLIGLELMTSIRDYLRDSRIHAELMLLVAMTAVTRKVVIMDAKEIDPMILFGIGFMIIALAIGYFLVRRSGAGRKTELRV